MVWFFVILFILVIVIPFFCGLFGINLFKIESDETSEREELNQINKQERLNILDETIVKYNRLVDSLTAQYNTETDEKKRSLILSKQIAALEKLNRALEKREKIE